MARMSVGAAGLACGARKALRAALGRHVAVEEQLL